ncbi:MAG: SDR family oxidoreductase [Hyphomonadaceae bacterium]|nr:SDR family oxidoreductase [Hyphomonadaceae bacterium]
MTSHLDFEGRVAVVTGAGGGLGRSHAKLLASRGAVVVVNDIGTIATDAGPVSAAQRVVEEIQTAGGSAVADLHSVQDGEKIVETALSHFGRVDIAICNAGILRDRSFKKMTQQEWDEILDVHLTGSFKVAHAAWPHFQERGYGRLVFTASAAGLYGNFGQANYSAAKLGIYGLTRTLAVEGAGKNIRSNCIAPLAASQMAGTVFSDEMMEKLQPEAVSPLVGLLCHETCPDNGAMFEVGGGWIGKVRWERAGGAAFDPVAGHSIEDVAGVWSKITDFPSGDHPDDVASCFAPFARNLGIDLSLVAREKN